MKRRGILVCCVKFQGFVCCWVGVGGTTSTRTAPKRCRTQVFSSSTAIAESRIMWDEFAFLTELSSHFPGIEDFCEHFCDSTRKRKSTSFQQKQNWVCPPKNVAFSVAFSVAFWKELVWRFLLMYTTAIFTGIGTNTANCCAKTDNRWRCSKDNKITKITSKISHYRRCVKSLCKFSGLSQLKAVSSSFWQNALCDINSQRFHISRLVPVSRPMQNGHNNENLPVSSRTSKFHPC